MRENLYLNRVVPDVRLITNKVNKEREKRKHRSQEKNYSSKLICTVVFLKESDTSLWLDKVKFLNEPKLTELAKQNIAGVNTIHTRRCVTFDITVNSSALIFFKQTFL